MLGPTAAAMRVDTVLWATEEGLCNVTGSEVKASVVEALTISAINTVKAFPRNILLAVLRIDSNNPVKKKQESLLLLIF